MAKSFLNFFHHIGAFALFSREVRKTCACNLKRCAPFIIEQIAEVGTRSIATVCFAGFFVGAILVIQFYMMLAKYDAIMFLGGLNTSACVREVGPLIISFLLAGKIGAFTAAELGTMRVTEQIDAVSCLGKNPIEYLVVPRYVAIVVCSLLLLMFGLVIGVGGSLLVACWGFNMNVLQYLQSVPRFTDGFTVFSGLFKSFVYGSIVATVCTYKGFYATGGAKGVGKAVTEAAVYTNLLIVLTNSLTSVILEGGYSLVVYFFEKLA